MSEASLAIAYIGTEQAAAAEDSIFVRLTQVPLSQVVQDANYLDIYQMLTMAAAGMSARNYVDPDCPIQINEDGTVVVALDFYAWPSDLALTYSLSPGFGEISAPVRVALPVDRDVVFAQSDTVELDYLLEPEAAFLWASPCFDEFGREVAQPSITVDGNKLVASASIFGVCRLIGQAAGYRHTLTMTLVKFEETEGEDGEVNRTGYKIENLQNHVTASWQGEDGIETDVLDMKIPKCVEDYLAECEDGTLASGFKVGPNEEEPIPLVYFSTCNGQVLAVRYV